MAATKQEVVDLGKYLFLADPNSCDLDNVIRMPNVVKYLNELRRWAIRLLNYPSKQRTYNVKYKLPLKFFSLKNKARATARVLYEYGPLLHRQLILRVGKSA